LALGRYYEDGISFAYVDGSDFENPGMGLWFGRDEGEGERSGEQGEHSGEREQSTAAGT
jgi:hypothetical protein